MTIGRADTGFQSASAACQECGGREWAQAHDVRLPPLPNGLPRRAHVIRCMNPECNTYYAEGILEDLV